MIAGFLMASCNDSSAGGYCWFPFDWLLDAFVLSLVLPLEFVSWAGWLDAWSALAEDTGFAGWLILVVACGWSLALFVVDVFWLDVFVFVWLLASELDWSFDATASFVSDFTSEGSL